jgi:outer membrane receptor protein involved in Fe transport
LRHISPPHIHRALYLTLLSLSASAWAQTGDITLPTISVTDGQLGGAPVYQTGNADMVRTQDDIQPYTVIDAAAIEKSGATSVEDLLRSTLSMNTSVQATTSDGWMGTTSQINLRGLGATQTLVLVNGRRRAGVGTRGTAEMTDQQNINDIPLSAIERIEVLPSSASAIYGANAIGGVINVVLKRDYVGTELNVRYGDSFDSNASTKTVNLTSGFSFNEGSTRVMVMAQKQWQNALKWKDRDIAEKGRARIMERDPGSFYGANPPYGDLVNIRSKNGSPLTGVAGTPNFTYIPKGYQGVAIDGVAPLLANLGNYALGLGGGISDGGGNFTGIKDYIGENRSDSFLLSLNQDISKTFRVFMDMNYERSRVSGSENYHGLGVFTVPAAAPGNPFGKDLLVTAPIRYEDGFARATTATVKSKGITVGLSWDITPQWQLNADYAYSLSRVDNFKYRQANSNAADRAAALLDGTLDLLRDTTTYPATVWPYFTIGPNFTEQKLHDWNLRATGVLASWYAGDIGLATGFGYRKWKSEGISDPMAVRIPPPPPTEREQNATSLYAELTVPLVSPQMKLPGVRLLEMQLAGRHERFDNKSAKTKFDATMPTVGFRYAPNQIAMLRGSWGKGFVTPTVSQLTNTVSSGTITAPGLGGTVAVETLGGNSGLEPEKSTSRNLGLILTPTRDLRLSFDWFRIEKDNNITSLSAQAIWDRYPDRVSQNPDGTYTIDIGPFNALGMKTSGVDTSIAWQRVTPIGDLALNLGYTYTDEYRVTESIGGAPINYVNLASDGPLRHRANASAFLKINPYWAIGWGMQYYGAYRVAADPTAASVKWQGKNKVDAQMYHDVFATLTLPKILPYTERGELTLGIKNLFDETTRDMSQSTYLSIFSDARGRQYYVNMKISF